MNPYHFYIGYAILGLIVGSLDAYIGYRKGMIQAAWATNPGTLIFGEMVAFVIWPLTLGVLIKRWDGKFK